ncbi:MAG TPA: sigma-70 family RNA polymerase sigma factor [Bryobacteraceae bacterium]|jgi:RNA polymerase sigma-70 factor (ECF subfamily)
MEILVLPGLVPAAVDNATRELADFDAVVQLYRTAVFRFLLASLRDRDSAETLTQECFFKAYRARHQFRGEASVKTWLMRIAVNLVRDHMTNARMKFWRRTQRLTVDLSVAQAWLADRRSSPEAAVTARQQVSAIFAAVEKLPEGQRTVFLLRFVEDLEILEIAAATGLKEGTVKVHLFRALRTVRAQMKKNDTAKEKI